MYWLKNNWKHTSAAGGAESRPTFIISTIDAVHSIAVAAIVIIIIIIIIIDAIGIVIILVVVLIIFITHHVSVTLAVTLTAPPSSSKLNARGKFACANSTRSNGLTHRRSGAGSDAAVTHPLTRLKENRALKERVWGLLQTTLQWNRWPRLQLAAVREAEVRCEECMMLTSMVMRGPTMRTEAGCGGSSMRTGNRTDAATVSPEGGLAA
jgi:hypothetical protein